MYDISLLLTHLSTTFPSYAVLAGDEVIDTSTTPNATTIIVSLPKTFAKDTEDVVVQAYMGYGSLLVDVTPIFISSPLSTFNATYQAIDAALTGFNPVPDDANYSSFALFSGEPIKLANNQCVYRTDWFSVYPRIS